jgi:SAM-dependent methyltransferase
MNEFDAWMAALEARHLSELTFPEVTRALRALSTTYVQRRGRIAQGAALSGAGKRAAFALFYGPIHYLLVREIVGSLQGSTSLGPRNPTLVDLGCGTGASSAAWAHACAPRPKVVGVDRHPWAVKEAAETYRAFGLSYRASVGDVGRGDLPREGTAFLLAFVLNELEEAVREKLLARLVDRAMRGDRLLVVEPLAGFVAPWWRRWRTTVESSGGRADEWRVRTRLPAIVAKLDRAAGLDHREITGRSLWMSPHVTCKDVRI